MQRKLKGKRLIFVLEGLELGGAERQVLLLSNYLIHTCNAKAEIWGFRDPGRAAELCDAQGIPWRHIPLVWPRGRREWLRNVVYLAITLRRAAPDAVLPYGMFPNIFCGLAWRLSGAKLCVWNQRDEGRYLSGKPIERWAVRVTPKFISNSRHGTEFLRRTYGIPPHKIAVVYNGVSLGKPEFDIETWRKRLGLGPGDFVACMVANLHSFKDHATLLRAWRLVIDRFQPSDQQAVLLLAGRFADATDSLKALAYDLELGRYVRFLGRVDDIAGLLKASNIGVFSSRTEGLPNGVLECMKSGLPVVATDIPGIREALGQEGMNVEYLIPPGDVGRFAEAILMMRNGDLRLSLGKQNEQRILQIFNPERMCEEMEKLLIAWL